jgi:hypothetical protein
MELGDKVLRQRVICLAVVVEAMHAQNNLFRLGVVPNSPGQTLTVREIKAKGGRYGGV